MPNIRENTKRVAANVHQGPPFEFTTVTTVTTTGAVTITAAQVLGGMYMRDPNGAPRTDTLPTAALLVAAVREALGGAVSPKDGMTLHFFVRNNADASELLTIAVGTGGTANGTMTIAQNSKRDFRIRITSFTLGSEAYVCYSDQV
jgi:hypothetical protein